MKSEIVRARGAELAVFHLDGASPTAPVELIWAHGWGQSHAALLPLAQAMRRSARSTLVDLPGFGASPLPPAPWGTADYADAIAEWLGGRAPVPRIWIGHSFGCRVGLQLAARHPGTLAGLFLIAAAGLPPQRTPHARLRVMARRWAFRLARQLTSEGPARDRLRARFGSADYRAAGELRPILVKAVGEDLTAVARSVHLPAVLVYGDRDSETPPELGVRLNGLMPQARLVVLRGFDHWNVLTEGRHQIIQRLGELMEQIG
ncbi:MAG TPA: alpha/beta fold hydrolase [Stellaceae bacterium]|nr:alpha/beta fold hydrolase [Stellaceae bacterium]